MFPLLTSGMEEGRVCVCVCVCVRPRSLKVGKEAVKQDSYVCLFM